MKKTDEKYFCFCDIENQNKFEVKILFSLEQFHNWSLSQAVTHKVDKCKRIAKRLVTSAERIYCVKM